MAIVKGCQLVNNQAQLSICGHDEYLTGYMLYGLPETARRVLESTGMAHCAMPSTNSSLQASSKRINWRGGKVRVFNNDYK